MASRASAPGVSLDDVKAGRAVIIEASDGFFAFVDGWRGRLVGINNGLCQVECLRPDGVKTLFVPPDQLVLTV